MWVFSSISYCKHGNFFPSSKQNHYLPFQWVKRIVKSGKWRMKHIQWGNEIFTEIIRIDCAAYVKTETVSLQDDCLLPWKLFWRIINDQVRYLYGYTYLSNTSVSNASNNCNFFLFINLQKKRNLIIYYFTNQKHWWFWHKNRWICRVLYIHFSRCVSSIRLLNVHWQHIFHRYFDSVWSTSKKSKDMLE